VSVLGILGEDWRWGKREEIQILHDDGLVDIVIITCRKVLWFSVRMCQTLPEDEAGIGSCVSIYKQL
jgi:hypothetical protein